jgi:hypothetical protein
MKPIFESYSNIQINLLLNQIFKIRAMKNNQKIEIPENEKIKVKENSEIAHWSKKYDISPEDLKNKEHTVGIYDKIVESYLQHAS